MLIICINAPVIFLVAIPFLGNYYMNVYMWTAETLHFIHGTCISISYIYVHIHLYTCVHLSQFFVLFHWLSRYILNQSVTVIVIVGHTDLGPLSYLQTSWADMNFIPPRAFCQLSAIHLWITQLLCFSSFSHKHFSQSICSGLNENVPQCLNTWFPVG